MLLKIADAIMKYKAIPVSSTDSSYDWQKDPQWGWIKTLQGAVQMVLVPILIVIGAAGALYAIVLGVNMARADSTEKREEGKKRLVALVIGIAVMIVLILFFLLLFPVIINAFIPKGSTTPETTT